MHGHPRQGTEHPRSELDAEDPVLPDEAPNELGRHNADDALFAFFEGDMHRGIREDLGGARLGEAPASPPEVLDVLGDRIRRRRDPTVLGALRGVKDAPYVLDPRVGFLQAGIALGLVGVLAGGLHVLVFCHHPHPRVTGRCLGGRYAA